MLPWLEVVLVLEVVVVVGLVLVLVVGLVLVLLAVKLIEEGKVE